MHARSFADTFVLEIRLLEKVEMRRETSRVSFLMCPFCVRAASSVLATHLSEGRPKPRLQAEHAPLGSRTHLPEERLSVVLQPHLVRRRLRKRTGMRPSTLPRR